MKIFILVIIASLFSISASLAKTYKLSSRGVSVELRLNEDWVHLKDQMGVPHLFLSNGESPKDSLIFLDTKLDGLKLNPKNLKKEQKKYRKGRRNWAEKRDAQIESFFAYNKMKSKNKTLHAIGFIYERGGDRFTERSYYLECNKRFFQIKTTVLAEREEIDDYLKLQVRKANCLKE